jgi:acetyltransferase
MDPNHRWRAANGAHLHLRRLRACDAPALGALIEALSPQDRRWRFHGAVNELPPAVLAALTDVDPHEHCALGAIARAAGGGHLVAEARWVADADGRAAEFALAVAPGWRRCGVGERCMHALLRAASDRGLDWLYGTVLADNAPMLALMRRCGFRISRKRGSAALIMVEARVDGAPVQAAAPTGLARLAGLLRLPSLPALRTQEGPQ